MTDRLTDKTDAWWWHGAVVYENLLPSLRDGDGDGIGDLIGLTASLDYLADLGIDAIWVGPCFVSPLYDQGYDVADYYDIEPTFGTTLVLDELLHQAHRRNIRILLDYIPNHTSHLHPFFVESRSSRTNPRADWYIWRNARPDGGLPNNWTSEAGGSVWEWDTIRGQYYLHSHLVEQPDLNWRNPEVRAEMLGVLRFWLEHGVDGFRIDVAHMLMKHPELPDHPPAPELADNPYDLQHPDFASQLHIYDRNHPDNALVMRDIRRVLDDFPGAIAMAEIEAMPWEDWAAYYGSGSDGIHLPFPFRLIETEWSADSLTRELRAMYASLPAGCWPIIALGNHDRSRLATRIGDAQARIAAMLLLTLRAVPCLLYGDELGYHDQPVPANRQRDYFARSTGGVSRDPVRTPMAWDDGPNAGFSTAPPSATWLPVAADAAVRNVAVQSRDPRSILNLYKDLLAMRRKSPAIHSGTIEFLDHTSRSVIAYRRGHIESEVGIALNLTGTPTDLPVGITGQVLLSTHRELRGRTLKRGDRLPPNAGAIVADPERRHRCA